MANSVEDAIRLAQGLAPSGAPMRLREPFHPDESQWFLAAVERGVVRFEECPMECFRRKKWGLPGPAHFRTPTGAPRHLFSKPDAPEAWLNREYIPHIGAYARAILDYGFDQAASAFSLYRKFGRSLISKRAGQSYETDAEFYDSSEAILLQIEAKADARQTDRLAQEVAACRDFRELRPGINKEPEYVLDLAPAYLWIVGPGSVEPATHVFEAEMDGKTARFAPVRDLPEPR